MPQRLKEMLNEKVLFMTNKLEKSVLSSFVSIAGCIALTILSVAVVSAQDTPLTPEVKQQIKLLTDDKQSRTKAQRKIDSNLLYAIKKDRHDPMLKQLPALETGLKT